MPWEVTSVMDERMRRFIGRLYPSERMAYLCKGFDI